VTPSEVYKRVATLDRPLTREEAQQYLLTLAVLAAAGDDKVRLLDISHVLTSAAAGAEKGGGGADSEVLDWLRDAGK
jgi:hypothetical protein